MDFITSDRSLKVGDIVMSAYKKTDVLYKIIEIEQRFIDEAMLHYDVYENAKVGDEMNPLITAEAVADYSINPTKKFRKHARTLDAEWFVKVTPTYIEAYIKKLQGLSLELWP